MIISNKVIRKYVLVGLAALRITIVYGMEPSNANEEPNEKKINGMLAQCQEDFELRFQGYKSKPYAEKYAIEKDLSEIALRMACLAQEKRDLELAKKCIEYGCDLGFKEARKQYIEFMRTYPKATPEECDRALKFLEESALQGNVDDQRMLAQIYSQRIQFFGTKHVVQADIKKAYAAVNMLLGACPEDVEGRFILGFIVGKYKGKYGITGQAAEAYELMSSVVDKKQKVHPSDYTMLGSLSFELGEYERAISWLERAGDFPSSNGLRGICMLIEAEKGNSRYEKNRAFDCIEQALSQMRKYILIDISEPCAIFGQKLFIDILKKFAAKDDQRAYTMLARIAFLVKDKSVGISKEDAFAYLLKASENGVESAQSFLGFMYSHGVYVSRSEEQAYERFYSLLKKQYVPNFVREEIADELYDLGKNPGRSSFHLRVAYDAIFALLQTKTDFNSNLALQLTDMAERALIDNLEENKLSATYFYVSGAWNALRCKAESNSIFAALAGSALCRRYVFDIIDWRTLQEEGIPLIEKALQEKCDIFDSSDLAALYVKCVQHAVQIQEKDIQGLCNICNRALEIDPYNEGAILVAASLPFQYTLSDEQKKQCTQKNIAKLEKLAKEGNDLAALYLGSILLQFPDKDGTVARFKAGIDYLCISAKRGDQYAFCAMVGVFLKEKGQLSQYARRAVLECLNVLMSNKRLPEVDQLYYSGFKSLAQRQLRQALEHFELFAQKTKSPDALIKVASCLSNFSEGYGVACQLLVRAIEIAGSRQIRIEGTDMKSMLQKMVPAFEDKAQKSPGIAKHVAQIKGVLELYKFVL